MWGAKGVMTTHGMYEWGVATSIAPLRLHAGFPTAEECAQVMNGGIIPIFKKAANDIYALTMYERFIKKGWTNRLARETREFLAPLLVRVVTLAWYEALMNAQSNVTSAQAASGSPRDK